MNLKALSYLPKLLLFLPLIKALMLFAEDSGKPGAEKLAAVLDAVLDVLENLGIISQADADSIKQILIVMVNAIVRLWNTLGWPSKAEPVVG